MQIPNEICELIPNLVVPKTFWGKYGNKLNCLYVASCELKKMLFISESFIELLGYTPRKGIEGGLDWWLSIVHPDDLKPMLNELFMYYSLTPAKQRLNKTFTLQYRVKNAFGAYKWISETKFVVSLVNGKAYQLVLGRFEDITDVKREEEAELKRLLADQLSSNQMLKYILSARETEKKSKADPVYQTENYTQPEGVVAPTKRELEILDLIGEGYSTKQIADKLFISISTVETHRRHLLRKLQVKNSMELVKRSTHAFWLKVAV